MRLIDAEQIGLTDMEIFMCDGNYKKALEMLIDKIAYAPTIEVPQRMRGKWIGGACRLGSAFDVIDGLPSVQPDKDMIHLQKEQAYMQGWEDGRDALREEIWENERDRLD